MAALREIVQVTRHPWGEVDGREVEIFRLASRTGLQAEIAELGGAIVSLTAQGRDGEFADVVLGFDDLGSYLADTNPYFGAVVGRYANRIAGGRFTLDGEVHTLPRNDGDNSLHGGVRGLSRVVWEGEPFEAANGAGVVLRYRSSDGEEGYPGNVDFQVRYLLTSVGDLRIEAEAVTDEAHCRQSVLPLVLQPQGGGRGRHPGPRAVTQQRAIHAGRRHADSDR